MTMKGNALFALFCCAPRVEAFTSLSTAATRRDRDRITFLYERRSSSDHEEIPYGQYSARRMTDDGSYTANFLADNGLEIVTTVENIVTSKPPNVSEDEANVAEDEVQKIADSPSLKETSKEKEQVTSKDSNKHTEHESETSSSSLHQKPKIRTPIRDAPATVVPKTGFNVVLTHCTADFDSLASAVGLAKLWASEEDAQPSNSTSEKTFDSASHYPTFVVLPRGAHPGVQRFLSLHKHLFPIRSLKSLPDDLSGLNRLALVDAQRRDRIGPAEPLIQHANRITVVDHHIDQDSDIPATDYVVDQVGSVSTLMAERLKQAHLDLTEAESTLLALGIHADTGSLCFDSTTPRDALALAWCLEQGASQPAIAQHAQTSLSSEQQGVLTQALINSNSTLIHGVTVTTVLLSADGFINGLAAVTQDALELSSSDIFLLALVYEAKAGGRGGKNRNKKRKRANGSLLTSRLLTRRLPDPPEDTYAMKAEAWEGGEDYVKHRRFRKAFDRFDLDMDGYLDRREIAAALASSGVIATQSSLTDLMDLMDADGNGEVDFNEFVQFAEKAEKYQHENDANLSKGATTMIVIGRVKTGVSLKSVKLNKLLENFGGGGHAKAASATIRLNEESEASGVLEKLVEDLIETGLNEQPTVGDFMTAPVLSVQPNMNENQVEDMFTRYDVRALPVVDQDNDVIGLVTYKEVAAAKQRAWNKEQKRIRQEREMAEKGVELSPAARKAREKQNQGATLKGWMLQHVQTIEAGKTMAEVEGILLENDVGCMPVVADGTQTLVGMVTRTDLLRQHRYYQTLHYHNKGFVNSIADRKPIIELRKRLKKFDLDE